MMKEMAASATSPPPTARDSASKVAKWLLEKGRPDEAVNVLTAWAVTGPNDLEGQQLLAEALRIDPSAAVAKAAFERMEGISGDHSALDLAILKYDAAEISRLEREISKPSFRRAQVGFNNNLKFRDQVFHVQTEDSGLDKPHIITHLFADGGRVIKSHKRNYAKEVMRADVAKYVRALMKEQHMEMVLLLREGKFDEVIAGRALGGIDTLDYPPNIDVRKLKQRKDAADEAEATEGAAKEAAAPAATANAAAAPEIAPKIATPAVRAVPPPETATSKGVPEKVRVKLTVVRSLTGGPDTYSPPGDEIIIGSSGAVPLTGERFCHPREAVIRFRDGKMLLEDCEGGNGVFLRIRTPVEMDLGGEFIVGDQLIRILDNAIPDVSPDPGPTYFYSSPTWPSSFRVVQIYEGGQEGACVVARGTTLIVGKSVADLVIAHDPLVEDQHCLVEEQASVVVLTDLGSRTGVFVRIKGEQELQQDDEMLIGRTRLKVSLLT